MGWGTKFKNAMSRAAGLAKEQCERVVGRPLNSAIMRSAEPALETLLLVQGPLAAIARRFELGGGDGLVDGHLVVRGTVDWSYLRSKSRRWTGEEIRSAQQKGYLAESDCCGYLRRNKPDHCSRTVFFVNGVRTTAQHHEETLTAIGRMTCRRTLGVYNATSGFLFDALDTGLERKLARAAFSAGGRPAVDGYPPSVKAVRDILVTESISGDPGSLEIWAHSEGGAIAAAAIRLAQTDLLSLQPDVENPLKELCVRSFGSAAPFWNSGPTYEHYIHVSDFTPVYLGLGLNMEHDVTSAGTGATVLRFAGDSIETVSFTDIPHRDAAPNWSRFHDFNAIYMSAYMHRNENCNISNQ